jgi:hypothetical protein
MVNQVAAAVALLCSIQSTVCNAAQSASYGVRQMPTTAFAQAEPGHIWLSPDVLNWAPADQALVIAHEARHVQDFADGVQYALGYACYVFESRGYTQQARTYRALFGDSYDPSKSVETMSREVAIWADESGGSVTPGFMQVTGYRDICR